MKLVPKPNPAARRGPHARLVEARRAREAVIGALLRVVSLMRRLERRGRGGFGRGFVYIFAVIAVTMAAIGLARRQLRAQRIKLRLDLRRYRRALNAVGHIRLHRDRPFAAITPDDARLPDKTRRRQL